jgi:biotin transport system substrate-specific component
MSLTHVSKNSLSDSAHRTLLRDVALAVGFALALGASAQWKVFLLGNPVPMTMQTVVVLLCGFWLRPRLALSAVCLYYALGLATAGGFSKMPFFAAYQAGVRTVTLGYIVGFLPAALGVSVLIRRLGRVTLPRVFTVGALGTCVIFAFGLAWIATTVSSLEGAISMGLLPFLVPALLKLVVVAVLVSGGKLVANCFAHE